jgi:aminopeptidase N
LSRKVDECKPLARGIMTRTIQAMGAEADEAAVRGAIKAAAAWEGFVGACKGIITDATANTVDRAWVEEALCFPGVAPLVQQLQPVDPLLVFNVVKGFSVEFAGACQAELQAAYTACKAGWCF